MSNDNPLADIEAYRVEQAAGNGESDAVPQTSFPPLDIPVDLLRTYEWVIDQFIYNGCMNISGTHGTGKTTALVPITLAVAGIVEFPGMPVTIPRNVLYVAEDPDQVFRLMHGAIEHQNADPDLIRERIRVVRAQRKPIEAHTELAELATNMHWQVSCPAGRVEVKPLVLYDTTAASFQLQNENDNSEVSLAISRLRHMYPGYPLWLTTHQPKAIARGDIANMTSRGAGAWEADVQGVFYLFVDEDEKTRVLYGDAPVKRRDTGTVREVSITAERHTDKRTDRFGIVQTVPYFVVELQTSTREIRQDRAAEAKEENKRKLEDAIHGQIVSYLGSLKTRREHHPEQKQYYASKKSITDALTKKVLPRDPVRQTIDDMLDEGDLVNVAESSGTVKRSNGNAWRGTYIDLSTVAE